MLTADGEAAQPVMGTPTGRKSRRGRESAESPQSLNSSYQTSYHTPVPPTHAQQYPTPYPDQNVNYDSDASVHSQQGNCYGTPAAIPYPPIDHQGYQSDASVHSVHSQVGQVAGHDPNVNYDSDASVHSQRSYALHPEPESGYPHPAYPQPVPQYGQAPVNYDSDHSVHSNASVHSQQAGYAPQYGQPPPHQALQRSSRGPRQGIARADRSDVSEYGYESAHSVRSYASDYADPQPAYPSDNDNDSDGHRGSDSESHAYHSAKSDAEYQSARSDGEGFALPGRPIEDPLMPDQYKSCFSKARHNKYKDVESMFLDGAPVDGRDHHGNTVLHVTCQNGHKRLAKSCLRAGANVNAQNLKGQTPLHFCFAFGYPELGEYLIERVGADPHIKNYFGLNAYEGLGIKRAQG